MRTEPLGTASSYSAMGPAKLPAVAALLAAPTDDDPVESHSDASGASDESDVCHLAAICSSSKQWATFEDEDNDRVVRLASRLREQPLLPPEPHNAEVSFGRVQRGFAFPHVHSAFVGCSWCDGGRSSSTSVAHLYTHLHRSHAAAFREALGEGVGVELWRDYYTGAIKVRSGLQFHRWVYRSTDARCNI